MTNNNTTTESTQQTGLDDDGCAWVPEGRYDALRDTVTRLNRRAAKLGTSPIGLAVLDERYIQIRGEQSRHREIRIQITGDAPRLNGWTFVAKLSHRGEAGNLVLRAPSERDTVLPESLWIADAVCEHCQKPRRRNDTFILRGPDGVLRQVGRNCLADFIRTTDVAAALAFWRFLYEVETNLSTGEGGGSGLGVCYDSVLHVLTLAATCIRKDGWVSKARAEIRETSSTRNTVDWLLSRVQSETDRIAREAYRPTDVDTKLAADTLDWVRRMSDPSSDYERNLKVALTADYSHPKDRGIIVSAVQAQIRRTTELEAANRPATEGYYGEVGQRVQGFRCRVVESRLLTGGMYVSTLNVLHDAEGHAFKWFASGDVPLTVGRDVVVTGTIKKHEEWKGQRSTVLTRCKIA